MALWECVPKFKTTHYAGVTVRHSWEPANLPIASTNQALWAQGCVSALASSAATLADWDEKFPTTLVILGVST